MKTLRKGLTLCCAVFLALLAVGTAFGAGKDAWRGQTITVAIDDRLQNQTMKKLVPEFTAATGIKVDFIEMPELTLFEKASLDLESGTGIYDVIQYDFMRIPKYGPKGKLLALNEFAANPDLVNKSWFARENFPKNYLEGMSIDGKLYGLPLFCHTNFLHYRKDLFKKYGIKVPTTFAELSDAAKKLTLDTNGDGKIDQFGIALRGQRGESINMWVYPMFLWAYGGQFFDSKWKPTFNGKEGVAALNKYVELLQRYGPPGAANYGWTEIQNGLLDGHIAMVIDVEFMGLLSEDPKISKVVGKMGHTYIPLKAGVAGFPDPASRAAALWAWAIAINGASEKKEAAWQFVQWWTSTEIGLKCGYFSTKAAIRAAYKAIPNPPDLENTADIGLKLMDMANPNYKPRIPEWVDIGEHISIAVSEVLTNQKDAKTALDEAASYAENALSEAGYY
jgi:multiple sugar transport system substrate-binding protein